MKRKQTTYNKPVGIRNGVLYLVNYTFEDTMHDKPFVGVTGSNLVPYTQAEAEQRSEPETFADLYEMEFHWREAVKEERTTESYADWLDSVIQEQRAEGKDFPMCDDSDTQYINVEEMKKYFGKDIIGFECVGGGRCFHGDDEFDVVLDQHLLNEIRRLEAPKEKPKKKRGAK